MTLVLGRKGSGKSRLTKLALRQVPACLIWDPMSEYDRNDDDARELETRVWHSVRDFAQMVADGATIGRETFQCPEGELEAFCRFAFACGDLLLVLEEVDMFCSAGSAPPYLRELFRRSRNRQIDLICVSKRPADVPKDLTSQADSLLLFGTSEPRDVAYYRERVSHEVASTVSKLDRNSWIRVEP